MLTELFSIIVALDGILPLALVLCVNELCSYISLPINRMSLAQNWRRRGMFDEIAFVFPNAPMIPITVVCLIDRSIETWLSRIIGGDRTLACPCLDGTIFPNLVVM